MQVKELESPVIHITARETRDVCWGVILKKTQSALPSNTSIFDYLIGGKSLLSRSSPKL